ncbi:transposase [Nocardia sp. NBC_01377]|uniref:IS701 family transposase n=1 Tax=Nocardia sp. NBC_01377 TaxID=2903595 RepID=UPI00324F3511
MGYRARSRWRGHLRSGPQCRPGGPHPRSGASKQGPALPGAGVGSALRPRQAERVRWRHPLWRWTSDRDRCADAGIPGDVEFATKPQQVIAMLGRVLAAEVPFTWFTADEAYGQNRELRRWLEDHDVNYVMATRRDDPVATRADRVERADVLIAELPAGSWQRLSVGAGAHGPREYDWAYRQIDGTWARGRGHWLVARRSPTPNTKGELEIAYYLCYGPASSRLVDLAWTAGARWHVEEALCATRRSVISPVQPGGTGRRIPGSDGLPRAERIRGTRACHVKPVTGSRRQGRCAGRPARHGESWIA